MNIRDLEYLVALAENKHFRRAAEICNVSQPTLSGQIRKLEEELQLTLLERTSRRVLFTPAGLSLVNQAKIILNDVQIFKEMANGQGKEMRGPLHIGVIPTLGPYITPYIVPTIKEHFPEIELFLYEAKTHILVEQLESGKIDCAILSPILETEPFVEVPMFAEKMLLAIHDSHPWAKEQAIPLEKLRGQELLMLDDDGHCLRDQAMGYCVTAGATENPHFQATSLETLCYMISSQSDMTLMPELAMLHYQHTPNIKYIPFKDPEPMREVALIYRPGSPLKKRYERIADVISEAITPKLNSFTK